MRVLKIIVSGAVMYLSLLKISGIVMSRTNLKLNLKFKV